MNGWVCVRYSVHLSLFSPLHLPLYVIISDSENIIHPTMGNSINHPSSLNSCVFCLIAKGIKEFE